MTTGQIFDGTPDDALLDAILAKQLVVAWAGEAADPESPRLGWWRTDMLDAYGGVDLLHQHLPRTWRWAVLDGAREAATRVDAAARARAAEPDHLLTLYHLGADVDERLRIRLDSHVEAGVSPDEVLPKKSDRPWSRTC